MTYARTDHCIHRPLFHLRVLLARRTNAEMNRLSSYIKMKTQLKQSRKARRARPNRIEVVFAKQELNQRIRIIVNAASAARGGIARMTLSDWTEVEAELTQTFANGLRVHRRWISSARDPRRHFGPMPTRE